MATTTGNDANGVEMGQQAWGQDSGDNYESDTSTEDIYEKTEEKSKKPINNAFTQQRLKAYNPVFTVKTVIPLLVGIAIFFIPLGAGMWYASHTVKDITIDYTQCELLANYDYWTEIPDNFTFNFNDDTLKFNKPVWKLEKDESWSDPSEQQVCKIQFQTPIDLNPPLYFFYRLIKFHANHRRYVKSYSEDQINGKAASVRTIRDTVGLNCEPLSVDSQGKKIYPCGLIANSVFNDTYTSTLTGVNGTTTNYQFSEDDIAWSTNKNRFKKTTYNYTEIVPPPNWYHRYPNGYNETNVPDISKMPHFQNWMQASALPDFVKLYFKNTNQKLPAGTYELSIGLHWPVLPFNGSKLIFISQRSVIGGKNIFLGVSWMAGGGICLILAIFLLTVNFVKPRKTGDINLLSWNRESFEKDEK